MVRIYNFFYKKIPATYCNFNLYLVFCLDLYLENVKLLKILQEFPGLV